MSNQAFARTTTDRTEIKKWTEERGGQPAIVRSRINPDANHPSISFPGQDEKHLEPVSWNRFFDVLESRKMQFVYMDESSGKRESRFFKIIPA